MTRLNIEKIQKFKNKRPIVCLTAYTTGMAEAIDDHVDIILVGDSVANVLYGMNNTQSITLDMMKNHGKAVVNNVKKSLTVIDMPINTYQTKKQALKNAKDLLNYTKANFVKLENDKKNINILEHLTKNKINVVSHIGVTPQKFSNFKKIKSVGKNNKETLNIIKLATELEKAGSKFIVLECIKQPVAKKITSILKIPTIGIGSSKYCDAQVLVINDILNIDSMENKPKFVKKYLNLNHIISSAVEKYVNEVKNKKFPSKKYSYY